MPTLLTAPGVETSERLSEPLKKLLGTWREVVHEEGGNRDYAGLTWNFALGRVTTWYPELPDRQESYAVYPEPGFIVDPTGNPPRLDLVHREPVTKSTWIQPGIYAWDGERLKWCLSRLSTIIEGQSPASIDGMRPQKFETAAEGRLNDQVLVNLERSQKPLETPARRPEVSGAQAPGARRIARRWPRGSRQSRRRDCSTSRSGGSSSPTTPTACWVPGAWCRMKLMATWKKTRTRRSIGSFRASESFIGMRTLPIWAA